MRIPDPVTGPDLVAYRTDHDLTQSALARQLGVCKLTIYEWERAKKPLRAGRLLHLALRALQNRHTATPIESGADLRARRAAMGYTQARLAAALETTPDVISKWEGESLAIRLRGLVGLAIAQIAAQKGGRP